MRRAANAVAERSGGRVASVVHLAGYYDFTGEDSPLYEAVNEEGTRRLLRALNAADLIVEQFVYAGTMLVHRPGRPGERIDEATPIEPGWAYPKSKARTEAIIREEAGAIPFVLLHLAGLYDDETAVPTLSHQIARVYEREIKSHVYSGDTDAGQAFLHQDDMLAAFEAAIRRRDRLGTGEVVLVGEPDPLSYDALQRRLGQLIHGAEDWQTLVAPAPVAKLGAAAQVAAEPAIPDAYDQGQKPFIRPFMIDMASDHYALDISKAHRLLGWSPRHDIRDGAGPPGRRAEARPGGVVRGQQDHPADMAVVRRRPRGRPGGSACPRGGGIPGGPSSVPLGALDRRGDRHLAGHLLADDRHPGSGPRLDERRPGTGPGRDGAGVGVLAAAVGALRGGRPRRAGHVRAAGPSIPARGRAGCRARSWAWRSCACRSPRRRPSACRRSRGAPARRSRRAGPTPRRTGSSACRS